MIEIASNRSWKKNEKKKHEHDAKYGWYRYNTKFVLPDGQIYDAQLLIRNSEDGKKYLYDMINIKKDSRSALARSTRERLYREQSSPTDMTTFNDDSISQGKSNVNGQSGTRYSLNNKDVVGSQEYKDLLDEYGAMPPGENPYGNNRDIQVPQQTEDDNRVGRFNRTAAEAQQTDDQTVDILMRELRTYKPSSNQKQMNYANNVIGSVGWERAADSFQTDFRSGKRMTANDVAIGERCIQEAQKAGDYKKAAELIGDVASLGVELGQAVQAMSMLKRLTPEGRLMALKRVQQRINADLQQKNKNKKNKNDITPKLKRAGEGSGNIYASDTIGQKQENMQQQNFDSSQVPYSSASQNNVASTDDIQNGNIYQTSGQAQQNVTQQDLGFKPVTISPETEHSILEARGPRRWMKHGMRPFRRWLTR